MKCFSLVLISVETQDINRFKYIYLDVLKALAINGHILCIVQALNNKPLENILFQFSFIFLNTELNILYVECTQVMDPATYNAEK